MTPTELMALGLHRIISMAMFQQLPQRWLWVAVKGGWRYMSAMAHGDTAAPEAAAERLDICRACAACELVQTGRADLQASYCGTGAWQQDGPTCGCLLAVTLQGRPIEPAGKLLVASEACPRGKWGASTSAEKRPAPIGDPSGR